MYLTTFKLSEVLCSGFHDNAIWFSKIHWKLYEYWLFQYADFFTSFHHNFTYYIINIKQYVQNTSLAETNSGWFIRENILTNSQNGTL